MNRAIVPRDKVMFRLFSVYDEGGERKRSSSSSSDHVLKQALPAATFTMVWESRI